MSRREDIDNAIWSDPEFAELTPEAKLVYLWSFTNQRCGMAGLYKVSRGAIVFECGMDPERVDGALGELADGRFVITDGAWLWVRSRVKHLRTRTDQIAKSIANDVAKMPAGHRLRDAFVVEYADDEWALREVHPNVSRGSDEVQETALASQSSEPHPNVAEPQPRFLGKGKGKKGGAGGNDALPDDLPAALHAGALAAHRALLRIHVERGGRSPSLAAVGRAVATYPRRDHAAAAADLEHWLMHGNGSRKRISDLVGYYRNWLSREPNAAVESAARASGADMVAALNARNEAA